MRVKNTILLCFFSLLQFVAQAQDVSKETLFTDVYTIQPEKENSVEISLDNLSFLKNNETDGTIIKGYTLPGIRLNPHVTYYPLSNVKLEAGLSLLKYWGANKYPNYTYRNIADWKADGYQTGFHFLPYFRAQIQPIPQMNIVMGNIYGGSNHRLIEPLYYPELNLTADPEMGVQFLYDSQNFHLDTWINWESFIFRNDIHGEAFTVGVSSSINLGKSGSPFYFEIPIQAIGAHRGGEIHETHDGVLTHINAYTGLRWGFNQKNDLLKKIELSVMGGGFTSTSAEKLALPFKRGYAFYTNISAWVRNFQFQMGYWRSKDFVNILGNPIFGNESAEHTGRTFPRVTVFHPSIRYEHTIGDGVYLGADFDYYYNPRLSVYENNIPLEKASYSGSSAFGIYLRINPVIVLKGKK
jgi:hypothetical protein